MYKAHRFLCEKGELITAESLKSKLLGKDEKTHMLIEVFKEHNRKMEAFLDTDLLPEPCSAISSPAAYTGISKSAVWA